MTHMDAIGLGEALLVGGGVSVAAAVGGTGLAICGTKFFNKTSQFFAEKEKMYPDSTWKTIACRIAKWAAIALSGITGTAGSLAVGLGVFAFSHILSLGTLPAVAIALGVGGAVCLEVIVINTIIDQIIHNRKLAAAA